MKFGRVLVTGGAGFVGSQLVRALLPISEHIDIIDDLSTGNRNAIPPSAKISFHHGSITDINLLISVLPSVQYIFHLACRNLALSAQDTDSDFMVNLYGGYMLLKHASQLSPQLKRFVYTSTASIYGNADNIPTPETDYQIKLPYSASKFSTEHYCKVFYHLYQFPVTILRLSNVFGPGQLTSNPYCGVVAKFFESMNQGEALTIYGDGKQTRDFTYIEDVLEAIITASLAPNAVGQIYNVGTGKEISINDLSAAVLSLIDTSQQIGISYKPKRVIDMVERRAVDIQKISIELNWRPLHSIEAGLMKTWKWFKHSGNMSRG